MYPLHHIFTEGEGENGKCCCREDRRRAPQGNRRAPQTAMGGLSSQIPSFKTLLSFPFIHISINPLQQITQRLRDPRGLRRGAAIASNGATTALPRQRGFVRPVILSISLSLFLLIFCRFKPFQLYPKSYNL